MPNLLNIGSSILGQGENTVAVHDYLTTGGQNLDPVTRAWCAAFVNATLNKAGLPGSGSNMARSFLNYGSPVQLANVQPGDIAVFPRGGINSPYGHVGFVQDYNPQTGMVDLLAGNQGNMVSVHPWAASQALGFRRADGAGIGAGMSAPDYATSSPGQLLASDIFGNRNPASGLMDMPTFQPPPMTPESFMMGMISGQNPLRSMVLNRVLGLFA